MLPLARVQLIPASLLLFIATTPNITHALDNPWPFALRFLSTSRSGHQLLTGRDGTTTTHSDLVPIAVRKMSNDQGEMFFPEYWQFEAEINGASKLEVSNGSPIPRSLEPPDDQSNVKNWANASMPHPLQAPFAMHTNQQLGTRPILSRLIRSPANIFALDTRSFACPSGTNDCTSINRPNSCCAAGLVCRLTTDTGLGDVGCCQPGLVCGQEISGCPTGDTLCPDSSGGGCCIPGSVCNGVGCESVTRFPQIVHNTNFRRAQALLALQ